MANSKVKNIFFPTLALVVICAVISGALAVTNFYTKDKIKEANKKQSEAAMTTIFTENGVKFNENTAKDDEGKEFTYSSVQKDGKTVGFIFTVAENGYGGPVSVMTGVNTDGTVKAIRVLSVDDETPGLGQTAKDNEMFAKQFEGKKKSISTEKNKDIDALTGATITTNAVIKDVNIALERYEKVKGE